MLLVMDGATPLDQLELHCPARRYDTGRIISLMKGVANMVSALWHFSRLEKLHTWLTQVSVTANGFGHGI
jgi:hypothetical protein